MAEEPPQEGEHINNKPLVTEEPIQSEDQPKNQTLKTEEPIQSEANNKNEPLVTDNPIQSEEHSKNEPLVTQEPLQSEDQAQNKALATEEILQTKDDPQNTHLATEELLQTQDDPPKKEEELLAKSKCLLPEEPNHTENSHKNKALVTEEVLQSGDHLKNKLLVAAIDFGTTYSGYAFSYKNKPEKIFLKKWISSAESLVSEKTPTCILISPQVEFHSFGYDAEAKYAELCEDGESEPWFFFKNFKMLLHRNRMLTRDTMLPEIGGKVLPALAVFSMAIEYLKKNLLEEVLTKRYEGSTESDIFWVLTVPAIWNDAAKQFMREAACLAGIESDQLMLALEPEAASIYCKQLPVIKEAGVDQAYLDAFQEGSKYILIDAGGGTIDISVHSVQDDGTLRSEHHASGGPWGGINIDKAFIGLLEHTFTEHVISDFIKQYPGDHLSLMQNLEYQKRKITPNEDGFIGFQMPYGLRNSYQCAFGIDIKQAIGRLHSKDKYKWAGDKLKLHSSLLLLMFEGVTQRIIEHIEELFKDPAVKDIKHVFLVGGFGSCALLQEELKTAFPTCSVTVPDDAQLTVLQGAVLYGYTPSIISTRCSAYTYGVVVEAPYIPGVHREDKKRIVDGFERCTDLLRPFIEKHQSVSLCNKISLSLGPPSPTEKFALLGIYYWEDDNVDYVSDDGCFLLGKIKVDMPDIEGGWQRRVHIEITAGGTELEVKVRDENTNKQSTSTFNFLTK